MVFLFQECKGQFEVSAQVSLRCSEQQHVVLEESGFLPELHTLFWNTQPHPVCPSFILLPLLYSAWLISPVPPSIEAVPACLSSIQVVVSGNTSWLLPEPFPLNFKFRGKGSPCLLSVFLLWTSDVFLDTLNSGPGLSVTALLIKNQSEKTDRNKYYDHK